VHSKFKEIFASEIGSAEKKNIRVNKNWFLAKNGDVNRYKTPYLCPKRRPLIIFQLANLITKNRQLTLGKYKQCNGSSD